MNAMFPVAIEDASVCFPSIRVQSIPKRLVFFLGGGGYRPMWKNGILQYFYNLRLVVELTL